MSPEAKAAVEGVIAISSFVILLVVVVAIVMMRGVDRNPRCRWCEHCRRAQADEQATRAKKRHTNYHKFTDRAPSACQKDDCPGRR